MARMYIIRSFFYPLTDIFMLKIKLRPAGACSGAGPATMHMTAASHRQINGRRDTLLAAPRTPPEKRGSVVSGSCNQVNEH